MPATRKNLPWVCCDSGVFKVAGRREPVRATKLTMIPCRHEVWRFERSKTGQHDQEHTRALRAPGWDNLSKTSLSRVLDAACSSDANEALAFWGWRCYSCMM
jgi:hypothetical protein